MYATNKMPAKSIAAIFIYLYVVMFAIGTGTVTWFITAELSNHFARPMTVAITTTLNWMTHLIVIGSFLPLWVTN